MEVHADCWDLIRHAARERLEEGARRMFRAAGVLLEIMATPAMGIPSIVHFPGFEEDGAGPAQPELNSTVETPYGVGTVSAISPHGQPWKAVAGETPQGRGFVGLAHIRPTSKPQDSARGGAF